MDYQQSTDQVGAENPSNVVSGKAFQEHEACLKKYTCLVPMKLGTSHLDCPFGHTEQGYSVLCLVESEIQAFGGIMFAQSVFNTNLIW